jgi:hypothetical protein
MDGLSQRLMKRISRFFSGNIIFNNHSLLLSPMDLGKVFSDFSPQFQVVMKILTIYLYEIIR